MNRTEHLLSILAEECGEVAQRAIKALRFSLEEVQPGQLLDNADRITAELADLVGVMEMLEDDENFTHIMASHEFNVMVQAKKAKVEKFLLLSKERGTLEEDQ